MDKEIVWVLGWSIVGWGRRIRTFPDGSRVRCPTARRFPNAIWIIPKISTNINKRLVTHLTPKVVCF